MFERVLFPTDFSVYANAVTACLPSLQTAGVKEVILLHVIRANDVPLPETYNLESYQLHALERRGTAKPGTHGNGRPWAYELVPGSNTVLRLRRSFRMAQEEHAGMIVIGAQGTTLAQELMIGSTAFEVIRRSPVPVLLEKAEVVRRRRTQSLPMDLCGDVPACVASHRFFDLC